MKIYSLIILILLVTSGCKKEKESNTDNLPPQTQIGANRFGCIINGENWIAQNDCIYLCDDPFKMYYDGGLGGNLRIICERLNSSKGINDKIIIAFDSTNYQTVHPYLDTVHSLCSYETNKNAGVCNKISSVDGNVVTTGSVTLTKYDLNAGIISGVFEFTLFKSGCNVISITNGRFDKKL